MRRLISRHRSLMLMLLLLLLLMRALVSQLPMVTSYKLIFLSLVRVALY